MLNHNFPAIALPKHIKIYIHSQSMALIQFYMLRVSSLGFHAILDSLPRLAAGDFVEPSRKILTLITPHGNLSSIPLDIRPAVNKVAVSSQVQLGTVGKVEKIN